ncbi:MAG: cytochrome b/b6 domain-containing protein [Woeseiaceae bacterium]|nr:cytochrome b/b6 domain-containing protein [Woeseiaceae bacterium]
MAWWRARAPNDTVEDYVIGIHISLGFFAFLFIVWRVAYRLYEGFPAAIAGTAPERWAAYLVHRALLIILTLQVLTGPLYLFTEGDAVNVFGWFSVSLPLQSSEAIHELIEEIHVVLGVYVIPGLLLVHIGGAIRHYLAGDNAAEAPQPPTDR